MTNSKFKREVRALSAKRGIAYQTAQQKLTAKSAAPVPTTQTPGWHGFAARVMRVIELAEAEARESKKRGNGEGVDAFSDAAVASILRQPEDAPAYMALLAELKSFDDADLRKLEALMYSGLERVSLRTMHSGLRSDTPEDTRSQIMSKRGTALPSYLRRALAQAETGKLDLDAFLPDAGLLRALSVAGASDKTLDHWDPQYLSLRPIAGGMSADPRVAEQIARENAARGDYALDLGHESLKISRAAGEALTSYLNEYKITFDRRRLAIDYTRNSTEARSSLRQFIVECLRWPGTFHDQTVAQLWEFSQRAGLRASVHEIAAVAAQLAREKFITQKAGDRADCFALTTDQLRALGGSAVPAWANGQKRVCVRQRMPGQTPGNTIEVSPDAQCTEALPGDELTHLTQRSGGLFADDFDSEPWPKPVTTLRDCEPGALVFANIGVWVASPVLWTMYEVMPS